MPPDERSELIGALRDYLEELQESGLDWLELPPQPAHPLPVYALSDPPPPGVPLGADGTAEMSHESLAEIRAELGDCRRCPLCQKRTNIVFGVGNPQASLLFVGEAPGEAEDLQGEPFVGEAGQLLTRMIGAMGFSRDDVYIGNVLKCRPPGNRNPHQEEITACTPFLLRQVRTIRPQVIIALGTFAAQTLLDSKEPISRLRGQFHDYHGTPLMPTFHPAFLLRSPERKRDVWNDLQQVMRKLGLPLPPKS